MAGMLFENRIRIFLEIIMLSNEQLMGTSVDLLRMWLEARRNGNIPYPRHHRNLAVPASVPSAGNSSTLGIPVSTEEIEMIEMAEIIHPKEMAKALSIFYKMVHHLDVNLIDVKKHK